VALKRLPEPIRLHCAHEPIPLAGAVHDAKRLPFAQIIQRRPVPPKRHAPRLMALGRLPAQTSMRSFDIDKHNVSRPRLMKSASSFASMRGPIKAFLTARRYASNSALTLERKSLIEFADFGNMALVPGWQ
jgi:hypothetical protein